MTVGSGSAGAEPAFGPASGPGAGEASGSGASGASVASADPPGPYPPPAPLVPAGAAPGAGPGGYAPATPPPGAGGWAAPSHPGGPTPVGAPGLAGRPAGHAPPTARRGGWPGALALALVLLLAAVAAFQAVQLHRTNRELDRTAERLAAAQAEDDRRLAELDGRAAALEREAGRAFNPEAIATAALPSVFRVEAGDVGGTAFAVGRTADGSGTFLFTNYHVVERVWERGAREVAIQRRSERYPATIVRVDPASDVAQLRTPHKFTPLAVATEAVKAGQPIVVVGAPLGLHDSVTTGVVSAFRRGQGGGGEVIQFDAPINPGNSGGPVINGSKQVVGIATAKARDAEGIGLAVPIQTACNHFDIC